MFSSLNIFKIFKNLSLPTNTIVCHKPGSQALEDSLFSLPFQGAHCFPEVWDPLPDTELSQPDIPNADGSRRLLQVGFRHSCQLNITRWDNSRPGCWYFSCLFQPKFYSLFPLWVTLCNSPYTASSCTLQWPLVRVTLTSHPIPLPPPALCWTKECFP